MAKNLNTETSIVDFLKSRGQDSSRASRAKLAVEQGIVKDTSQYTGTFSQNVALLNKVKGTTPNAPANVADAGGDAAKFINAKQQDDVAIASKKDAPPVRGGAAELVDAFKNITGKSGLLPDYTAPETPNFEQTFESLRSKFNVDQLETTINDLDAQEQDLQAQLRISTNTELGKPVALNVISGRVGEQERNMMERIDFIQRQKKRAVSQLQTANDAIENLMTFKKLDYDVAKNQYDTEFSQNIQLFNTIKGAAQFSSTEEDKAQDNARANLQIIYNSIQDGGDFDNIDAATAAKISKLELQSGLPQGFYKTIATQKPKAKVLSTTTRSTGGTKYADVLYRNPDGSLTTETVTLGTDKGGSGKQTESELQRSARTEIATQLNKRKGQDGYVSPQDYKKARSAWISKGFAGKDFDENFAQEYVNPADYEAANVSLY